MESDCTPGRLLGYRPNAGSSTRPARVRPPLPKCPPAAVETATSCCSSRAKTHPRAPIAAEGWILHDRGEALAQCVDVVHVLDRNACIGARETSHPGKLSDHLTGAEQARSTQQHFKRNDRAVKADRKILFQATHREAAAQEFRHTPMRKKRNLQDRSVRPSSTARSRNRLSTSGLPCASATNPTCSPAPLSRLSAASRANDPLFFPSLP